jgi:hypothetical protein
MTTTAAIRPTQATKRVPMTGMRKAALAGGAFYLITFAFSIPALGLIDPVLHANYIVGTGADTRVLWGCLFDLINALAGVGSAVALYPVVKRYGESLALGIVASRIYEMAVIMIGVVSLLAVVTLRKDGAAGAAPDSLVMAGRSLVAVRNWTFLVGPAFIAGVNALLLGTLMYRSRLVPRWIPTMGLVAAPFFLAAAVASILSGHVDTTVARAVTTLPIGAWEFSLGSYLVVKGFKPSVATAEGDSA